MGQKVYNAFFVMTKKKVVRLSKSPLKFLFLVVYSFARSLRGLVEARLARSEFMRGRLVASLASCEIFVLLSISLPE